MKSIYLTSLSIVATILFFAACAKDGSTSYESDSLKLPQTTLDYKLPAITSGVVNAQNFREIPDNPITNAGATLGRVLFYDKKLSLNNLVSCGNCHQQDKAFSDGKTFSPGFKGELTIRNVPALSNPCMDFAYFWDTRSKNLEELTLQPVSNHREMGMENLDNLPKKLVQVSYYSTLFKDAFGSPEITNERISKAMAQFVRSIVSINSKYDVAMKTNFYSYTDEEKRGFQIFTTKHCQNCHSGPNLNGWSGGGDSRNIELDVQPKDDGAANGRFKVPSLRNVALTAPYMHDGRFKTLEEVVEHYNTGVQSDPNLDFALKDDYPNITFFTSPRTGLPTRLKLTDSDKQALVAFLKTLTDNSFLADERYSNPFK